MKLAYAATMRQLDQTAIEVWGIPSIQLMETAAGYVSEAALSLLDKWKGARVAVFCGPGNNGGDGVAAARLLREAGIEVRALLVGNRRKMSKDTAEMERRLEAAGGMLEDYLPEDQAQQTFCQGADVFIDAIFGIGLRSEVSGPAAAAIAQMNGSNAPAVAVDIPSGVEADTGRILGAAVHAAKTVTFTLGKPGHFTGPGSLCCGALEIVPIGIPKALVDEVSDGIFAMTGADVGAHLPQRKGDGHKGDFGKLAIAAGSVGYTGAPYFAAQAAARTGVGLIFLYVPQQIYGIEAVKNAEAMVFPLPMSEDGLLEDAAALFLDRAKSCNVQLVGPGLGQSRGAKHLVREAIRSVQGPLILDADGLNCLAEHIDDLDSCHGTLILTPHEGEFLRLGGNLSTGDRIGAARQFVREHPCILVLKGHGTVTALPDGTVYLNSTGNSGMAKGGSGDVLSGMIAGLLGQHMEPEWAVPAAVWLHGAAGDLAANCYGEYGMLPSDMILKIPEAIQLGLENEAQVRKSRK